VLFEPALPKVSIIASDDPVGVGTVEVGSSAVEGAEAVRLAEIIFEIPLGVILEALVDEQEDRTLVEGEEIVLEDLETEVPSLLILAFVQTNCVCPISYAPFLPALST
jgi:hypothetical protein